MKKSALIFLLVVYGFFVAVKAQVTVGANTVPNATLEVVGAATDASKADGVIAPKLTLSQLTSKTAYGPSQAGAIVFITDVSGTSNSSTANITTTGYYFYDGAVWQRITTGSAGWVLKGNSGTTASTAAVGAVVNNNVIGTTDNTDMVVATNNFERMRILSGGNVAVGTKSPAFTTTTASASKPTFGVDGTINAVNYTSPVVPLATTAANGTINWDLSMGTNAVVTITGTAITLALTNIKPGMYGTLVVKQGTANTTSTITTITAKDVTSSAISGANKVINGGGGMLSFTACGSIAGAVYDIHCFFFDGTNLYWTSGFNYN